MNCRIRKYLPVLGAIAILPHLSAQPADEAIALGVRLQQQGDLDGAIAAFRSAVEAEPSRVDALSNLSVAYLLQGRPADAIPGLLKAREALPSHEGVAYYLGLAHFQATRFGEARVELEWVLERQPANGQARHLYALCLLKLGALEHGIGALEQVIEEDPSNRQAVLTLGSAYVRAGLVEKAEFLSDRHLRGDESSEALLIKGSVLLAKREHREALALFERAVGGGPDLPTLHSQTGVALLYAGRRERAAEEFRAELAANPGDFNANAFLGWLVQQEGQSERALEFLRTAHELNRDDDGVRYLLAQVHSARGSWLEAEPLLEHVIRSQPGFVPAHVMLARVYAKLKRRDRFLQARETIDRLNALQQERDLQGVDQLYDGRVLSMPAP